MRNWKFCVRKNNFRKGNIFIWLITMVSCLIPGYQSIKKIYGNIIVDHTHAFFQKPLKGIDTLYSCRKFWGVSDGAYLSTDASLTENKTVDYSAERMKTYSGGVMSIMPEPTTKICWKMRQNMTGWSFGRCQSLHRIF